MLNTTFFGGKNLYSISLFLLKLFSGTPLDGSTQLKHPIEGFDVNKNAILLI